MTIFSVEHGKMDNLGDQQIYKFIATYGHHNAYLKIKLQILRAERDQSFLKFGNKNIEISVSLQNGVD